MIQHMMQGECIHGENSFFNNKISLIKKVEFLLLINAKQIPILK